MWVSFISYHVFDCDINRKDSLISRLTSCFSWVTAQVCLRNPLKGEMTRQWLTIFIQWLFNNLVGNTLMLHHHIWMFSDSVHPECVTMNMIKVWESADWHVWLSEKALLLVSDVQKYLDTCDRSRNRTYQMLTVIEVKG